MLFTIKWLSNLFPLNDGNVRNDIQIHHISTDSRQTIENGLFIPLVGDTFDGHDYVQQAIENGVVATLWDKKRKTPNDLPSDFPIFFVEDTLVALQYLAKEYRTLINPTVIGITGSNGKTTTKDLVFSVVKTSYRTYATEGNLNNHIGVPLTILRMPRNTEVLIVEMGMNHFGEIETLSKITNPDISIITNIGESHIEYLGSRAGIATAKLEIIRGMKKKGCLIVDGDEPLIEGSLGDHSIIRCGFKEHNDFTVKHVKMDNDSTSFQLLDRAYTIPLLGKHNAKNASYAIIVAKRLNIREESIVKGLMQVKSTSMRFQKLRGINGVTIINDAYNASPTSMIAAIEVLKEMKGFKHKVLVLGNIFELGSKSKELHQMVGRSINSSITALFTYGQFAKEISNVVKKATISVKSTHAESKEQLIENLQPYLNDETIILFKASRGMAMEKIVEEIL